MPLRQDSEAVASASRARISGSGRWLKLTVSEDLSPLLEALHDGPHSSWAGEHIVLDLWRPVLEQGRQQLERVEADVEVLGRQDRQQRVQRLSAGEEQVGVDDTEVGLAFGQGWGLREVQDEEA